MKIGELNMHCGECGILELCGEPFSDICLCRNPNLEEITEEEYERRVSMLREINDGNLSNKELEELICKEEE